MEGPLLYLLVLAAAALPLALSALLRRREEPVVRRRSKPLVATLAEGSLGVTLLRLRRTSIEPLRVRLVQAGRDPSGVAEVFVAQVLDAAGFALAGAVVGAMLPAGGGVTLAPVFALAGAFVGWVMPTTAIANAVQTRQKAIVRALPFAIDLLVSAMRAGLDFGAAVRYYVNLGDNGPLTEEFAAMLRENELGTGRITALQNMADRVRIPAFSTFVSALALGTEMGSPLSDTMEIQGEELRKARYALAEVLAQKAPSKMILPMALFVMPAVFVVIFVPVYLRMKSAQ